MRIFIARIAPLFIVLLLCLVVPLSLLFVSGTGVNLDMSASLSVAFSRAILTFDRVVLWWMVIELVNLNHPINASRWVSNSSYFIHVHDSRRRSIMFLSSCLNYLVLVLIRFCVRKNNLIWICQDLLLYSGNDFVFIISINICWMFKNFAVLCNEFNCWV